ncbi:MAG: L-histidine N(alpha)-methyltransferase [Gammaproteobacteria bacterium]
MATDAARAEDLTEQDLSENHERAELIEGLQRPQKLISPKFFYDETGSELFDAICEQPEYYPTRTEIGIMQDNIAEIADAVGHRPSVIEFGSGASVKIRILLSHLHDVAAYVPVDVSREFLVKSADVLAADYPDLEILPVAADFTKPFDLPMPRIMPERNLVFFPGSTIGNFWPDSAVSLMKVMREEAREGGALLIGVDLVKDRATLERAYNDAAGYTERFNLNMLAHVNRRFGADFDLGAFRHRAIWNDQLNRIEMHLVSLRDQTVQVGDTAISFATDEYILSECSHKYTVAGFAEMAGLAGFRVDRVWTDEDDLFSVQYCTAV